jgi:hypothetical protein
MASVRIEPSGEYAIQLNDGIVRIPVRAEGSIA